MVKSDKTLYPVGSFHKDKNNTININKTLSNFKHLSNNSSKVDLSNQKQLKLNKSKQSFASMSDIPVAKYNNKNSSSRQKKDGLNLNNAHNSINSFNSFNSKNEKNYVITTKNKNINDKNKANSNLNSKNNKKVINYVRKKKKNRENQNKFLLIRKKKNYSIIENDENRMLNDITDVKDNKIFNCTKDSKYNTNYIIKNDKIKNEKTKIIYSKDNKQNNIYEINQKLAQLFNRINIIKNQSIKICFQTFKDNLPKNLDNKIEIENNINAKIDNLKNKIDNIDIT